MGKVDRATAQKKDNTKARSKFLEAERAARKEEDEAAAEEAAARAEEERRAAAVASTARARASASRGGTLKASDSSFAKASLLADDDAEDETPAAVTSEGPASSAKAKKEAAKKKSQGKNLDAFELMEQERREAIKQRVVDRLLRLLLVGFVIDLINGKSAETSSASSREVDKKGKKKGANSGKRSDEDNESSFSFRDLKEKAERYSVVLVIGLFTIALFVARAAEEGYHPAESTEFNYYEALGLTSDADQMAIRKAYKNLALTLHPDKNPNCQDCPEKFARISKAYDTLSNVENRKAYDSGRQAKGSVESASSVDLTAEDYELNVLRSNEVWYVQIYDPTDQRCKSFGAAWEDFAHEYKDAAKFGRLDLTQPGIKEVLPQRYVILPVILRIARGHPLETWQLQNTDEERGSAPLKRFMESTFPQVQRFEDTNTLRRWWAQSDKPRVLFAGPSSSSRAAKSADWAPVLRQAHLWEEYISVASAEAFVAQEALETDLGLTKSSKWALVARLGGVDSSYSKTPVFSPSEMVPLLEELISDGLSQEAPFVTVRNYHQICSSHAAEAHDDKPPAKKYCLFLVDSDASSTAKSLRELAASRAAYVQEVQELKASGTDSEEVFRIQPIRISTGTSRFPWNPSGAGPAFYSLWYEAKKAFAFVVEMDSKKIAGVRTATLNELYQQIAYEDLKLQDLPDGISFARVFPDPESSLRREFSVLLSSGLGALLVYLIVAVLLSILPELELPAVGATSAGAVLVLAILWPAMSRRFIGFFWCMVSPSNMECQSNI